MMNILGFLSFFLICLACKSSGNSEYLDKDENNASYNDYDDRTRYKSDSMLIINDTEIRYQKIPQTKLRVSRYNLVSYAKTLIGVPYKYASIDPEVGFDCSGFITHVFNHFDIKVPRSSVDFTNFGKEVSLKDAKAGDLILFTGTDESIRIVGHMGIVTANNYNLKFIHSTSGSKKGVTISEFTKYYKKRFVKIVRFYSD